MKIVIHFWHYSCYQNLIILHLSVLSSQLETNIVDIFTSSADKSAISEYEGHSDKSQTITPFATSDSISFSSSDFQTPAIYGRN